MQSIICRGCSQSVGIEKAKNIFVDALLSGSKNVDNHRTGSAVDKIVTVSSGLELVTGYSISKTDDISPYLCDECMEKLTSYVNFRNQLLSAHKFLMNSKVSMSTCNIILKTCEVGASDRDVMPKKSEKPEIAKREFNNSTESSNNSLDFFQRRLPPDNVNVDDNSSISSFLTDPPQTEYDTRDFYDQDNNNLNESDASNLSVDIHISEENGFKNQIHDVESDIDVCSGEEDDVLELDIPSRKNETIEIESSSESEIEVCDNDGDYIPVIKRAEY